MPRIHRLSQSVVNKIAAGEVIERPASVVKELMENAVDAGATRIDVSVAAGGLDLVRVVDNGCGIAPDDLPLAIASHATSKIATADDLFSVRTLGFRGEALASIAEVSRFVLRSRTAEDDGGAELQVVGGEPSPIAPCGCPVGTSVEVRNLFFNTPVRRKFLRAAATELGHVSEAFLRTALAMPQVHCALRHNDRPVFELPAGGDQLERIGRIFGRPLADSLIHVENASGEIRIAGYVAHPSQSRSNNKMQYLFLNGRAIRDRSLQHALGEAYRGLLMTGRFPIAVLFLEMPPELIDVNVHPTKLEVRFQDAGRLYSQLLSTLRTKFLGTDLTTRAQSPEGVWTCTSQGDPQSPHDDRQAAEMRQQVVDWAKGKVAAWGQPSLPMPDPLSPRKELDLQPLSRSWAPAGPEEEEPRQGPALEQDRQFRADSPAPPLRINRALQVHNRYLVAESDEGVVIIDQHALHERILYEQLKNRVLAGPIEAQTLLVPEPVDLPPAEAAAVLEQKDLLAKLGMRIEPFGGSTVLLSSYPAMLANINPVELLREVIDQIAAGSKLPERRDLFDSLLHTISCKAAIKAGDRLAPEEVEMLLEQRHTVDDAHHCPHGRPTELVFSREELDRQFRRI